VKGLAEESITEKPQDNFNIKHAPKIFTETCAIDCNKSAIEINNLIRGLSPYPAAFTHLDGKKLKIFTATIEKSTPTSSTGTYETDGKHFLKFACNDGYISITDLQLEGKKRMKVEDFLRGYRFSV
jgi:methionyl-tRNA formyltransferase